MHRVTAAVFALLLVCAVPTFASESHVASQAAVKTVRGEVVDMGCYLGHGAHGADHVSCATKCLAQGMPMGLLTENGTLYLVTLDHDNADPYVGMKGMAGKQVAVTGAVLTRNGMKAIEATSVKPAQ